MQEAYYKKTELSAIFTDTLKEHPEQKELLVNLWSRIKGLQSASPASDASKSVSDDEYKRFVESCRNSKDKCKSFAYEASTHIYVMLTDEEILKSGKYWEWCIRTVEKLYRKYVNTGSMIEKWIGALFLTMEYYSEECLKDGSIVDKK